MLPYRVHRMTRCNIDMKLINACMMYEVWNMYSVGIDIISLIIAPFGIHITITRKLFLQVQIDGGSLQDCNISIANALDNCSFAISHRYMIRNLGYMHWHSSEQWCKLFLFHTRAIVLVFKYSFMTPRRNQFVYRGPCKIGVIYQVTLSNAFDSYKHVYVNMLLSEVEPRRYVHLAINQHWIRKWRDDPIQ